MSTITWAILMILLIVVSLTLVIGISLGIGWILTSFLPFSLFEGTLLGMIAGIATFVIWHSIYRSTPSSEFEEEEDDAEVHEIPETQFWRTREERTWENWFRYMIANSVYEDLFDSLHWMGITREGQQQELSIRLADAAIEVLKRSRHVPSG